MFYQEKKTIVSIVAGILVLAAYSIYGISKYLEIGESLLSDLKFWSTAMLIAIIGGIILVILIQIIFHIMLAVANEVAKEVSKKMPGKSDYEEVDITEVEDERDKLIALKSMRNSFILVGIGFVISLISLFMKMPPAIMLNIIFIAFMLGSLFEGFSQLYFYRKGV